MAFGRIWAHGNSNTPMGHADDLPAFFGIFKSDPKSRSVNILFSSWILTQTEFVFCLTSQNSAQYICLVNFGSICWYLFVTFPGCGKNAAPPESVANSSQIVGRERPKRTQKASNNEEKNRHENKVEQIWILVAFWEPFSINFSSFFEKRRKHDSIEQNNENQWFCTSSIFLSKVHKHFKFFSPRLV